MLGKLRHREYKRALLSRLEGRGSESPLPDGGQTARVFTQVLFLCMGKLAKLDGRVSEVEIGYASTVMQQLGLDARQRQSAIDCFYQGKQSQTDIFVQLRQLGRNIGTSNSVARQFLKTLCRLAYSKGCIRLKEKLLLRDIAETLGFSKAHLLTICTEIQVNDNATSKSKGGFLSQAYRILQLAPDADDGEIRRAYRRMMSRYHPDKQMASGSGDTVRQAQEQFLAVRHAYETICGFRKMVNP